MFLISYIILILWYAYNRFRGCLSFIICPSCNCNMQRPLNEMESSLWKAFIPKIIEEKYVIVSKVSCNHLEVWYISWYKGFWYLSLPSWTLILFFPHCQEGNVTIFLLLGQDLTYMSHTCLHTCQTYLKLLTEFSICS